MKLRRRLLKEKEVEAINVSPLIDVVFILLIFFIVSATFVKVPGEEVLRPRAVTAESLEKNAILFALAADDSLYYAGKTISIDATKLAKLAREGKLAGAPVSIATRKPE